MTRILNENRAPKSDNRWQSEVSRDERLLLAGLLLVVVGWILFRLLQTLVSLH